MELIKLEKRTARFITIDKHNKLVTWCECYLGEKMFIEFIQYVLDCCSSPEDYHIYIDGVRYSINLMTVAELLGMRKRTFEERLKGVLTNQCSIFDTKIMTFIRG